MVTETIEQEDIKPDYLEIKCWIGFGITGDAIRVCRHKWRIKNDSLNYHMYRNSQNKYKQPVNRW